MYLKYLCKSFYCVHIELLRTPMNCDMHLSLYYHSPHNLTVDGHL